MSMPYMSTIRGRQELIAEGVSRRDGTLRDVGSAVHILSADLVQSVPVDSQQLPVHGVSHVHYNSVVLTHLYHIHRSCIERTCIICSNS